MTDVFDPKGLIRDAFAIEGISGGECRSIFLDWALGVPPDMDTQGEVRKLLAVYENGHAANHPMTETLRAALQNVGPPRRRGGRRARVI